MMDSRAARRLAALAAAFGIALQALWPAIAQARPGDAISVPICSVDGTRHEIQLPLGKTQDGSEHCQLCVLGLDPNFVSSDLPFPSGNGKDVKYIEADDRNPRPSKVFAARPRAPPAVS